MLKNIDPIDWILERDKYCWDQIKYKKNSPTNERRDNWKDN